MPTNLDGIIRELEEERNRIDNAIQALRSITSGRSGRGRSNSSRPRRRLSAAARRRIAEAQKARWARFKAAQKKS